MTTGPIPYPDLDALTPELRDAVTSRYSLNIFRMITHTPGLAPSFMTMAADVLQHNSLPATWRELAILRVGHRYECRYEIFHHVNIGKAVGLTDDQLRATELGSTAGLTDDEATVLWLTDRLLDHHTLDDDERGRALSLLSVNQLADLVLTVGFYQMVCNFLSTFAVAPEG